MNRVAAALVAIVVAGTIVYGSLSSLLRGPSVFADELIYMDATRSIADGHRPMERDRPYGRGLLFPALAAPVFASTPDDRDAYIALKWLNAFLFSLAALPAYALARRLLGRAWSLTVAALTVAAPSALYSGMVLTESTAYATGTLALLALALALERPTARRQLAALGAVVLGALARPQLAALVLVLPLGLAVRWLLLPAPRRPRAAQAVRTLWPSGVAFVAVALVTVAAFASGRASLKDYQDVLTSYDPFAVLQWSWYTLADLTLYLAFVPIVVAPNAIGQLWRRGRAGSTADGAFAGLVVSATLLTVLVVAAFSSAKFGFSRLHDRYLFYVVPVWLVVFAAWLERGAHVSRRALALGTGLAAVLVGTLPTRLLVHDGSVQFDAVATALWSRIRDVDPARPGALRALLVVAALAAGILLALLPRLRRPLRGVVVLVVAAVFVANAAIVWKARIADADVHVFANDDAATWSWVDRAVPPGHSVTDVYVDSGPCLLRVRDAFRWTEFFNGRIAPVLRIGLPAPPGVVTDGRNAEIGRDGVVRTTDGKPVVPGYVVAPPGLSVDGRRIAPGTLAHLQLWKVDGRLRVLDARSNASAVGVACPATAA
jgi:hypothetical protein